MIQKYDFKGSSTKYIIVGREGSGRHLLAKQLDSFLNLDRLDVDIHYDNDVYEIKPLIDMCNVFVVNSKYASAFIGSYEFKDAMVIYLECGIFKRAKRLKSRYGSTFKAFIKLLKEQYECCRQEYFAYKNDIHITFGKIYESSDLNNFSTIVEFIKECEVNKSIKEGI